ncbi:hypothetical protein JCM10212_006806 [Sporobolomyces blumeae]
MPSCAKIVCFVVALGLLSVSAAARCGPQRLDAKARRSTLEVDGARSDRLARSLAVKETVVELIERGIGTSQRDASDLAARAKDLVGLIAIFPSLVRVDAAREVRPSLEKRQVGVDPVEEIGTSNPDPQPGDLNKLGDSAPLQGSPNGAMQPFKRSLSMGVVSPAAHCRSAVKARSPHPVPGETDLNLVSHVLATRGRSDGTIEFF